MATQLIGEPITREPLGLPVAVQDEPREEGVTMVVVVTEEGVTWQVDPTSPVGRPEPVEAGDPGVSS